MTTKTNVVAFSQTAAKVKPPPSLPAVLARDRNAEWAMKNTPVLWRYQRDHLLAKIPGWQRVSFPEVYLEAKAALQQVIDLSECRLWKDHSLALAQKAKILHDDEMFKLAMRVQLQAYRHVGELIELIPPGHGANQNILPGDPVKVTRASAAAAAGLGPYQRDTALRLAQIPRADYDEAVESDSPPTVTQMAYGVDSIYFSTVLKKKLPKREALQVTDTNVSRITWFASYVRWHIPRYNPGTANIAALRGNIAAIRSWLDKFEADLPDVDLQTFSPEG